MQYPPEGTPERDKVSKIGIEYRRQGRSREVVDPMNHFYLLYDTTTLVDKQPKLIGQSGWRVIKPTSTDIKFSQLVARYQSRLRQLSVTERIASWIFWTYDKLFDTFVPNWLYKLYSPILAGIAARRKRWHANRSEASKKAYRAEDKATGYYMLTLLSVLPEYERRGIGAMMLKWGLDIADEDDAPVYVSASESGAKLYAKHGFELASKSVCFEGEQYGGFETVIMRRPRGSERRKMI